MIAKRRTFSHFRPMPVGRRTRGPKGGHDDDLIGCNKISIINFPQNLFSWNTTILTHFTTRILWNLVTSIYVYFKSLTNMMPIMHLYLQTAGPTNKSTCKHDTYRPITEHVHEALLRSYTACFKSNVI